MRMFRIVLRLLIACCVLLQASSAVAQRSSDESFVTSANQIEITYGSDWRFEDITSPESAADGQDVVSLSGTSGTVVISLLSDGNAVGYYNSLISRFQERFDQYEPIDHQNTRDAAWGLYHAVSDTGRESLDYVEAAVLPNSTIVVLVVFSTSPDNFEEGITFAQESILVDGDDLFLQHQPEDVVAMIPADILASDSTTRGTSNTSETRRTTSDPTPTATESTRRTRTTPTPTETVEPTPTETASTRTTRTTRTTSTTPTAEATATEFQLESSGIVVAVTDGAELVTPDVSESQDQVFVRTNSGFGAIASFESTNAQRSLRGYVDGFSGDSTPEQIDGGGDRDIAWGLYLIDRNGTELAFLIIVDCTLIDGFAVVEVATSATATIGVAIDELQASVTLDGRPMFDGESGDAIQSLVDDF